MDLVPEPTARQALHQTVSRLNATAEVHECTRCHLHLEHLLGRGILHNPPSEDGSFPAPGPSSDGLSQAQVSLLVREASGCTTSWQSSQIAAHSLHQVLCKLEPAAASESCLIKVQLGALLLLQPARQQPGDVQKVC